MGKGRKGKGKGERKWREGFGPPQNFGVAPLWYYSCPAPRVLFDDAINPAFSVVT